MANIALSSIVVAVIAAISALSTAIFSGIKAAKSSRQLAQLEGELAKQKELTLEYMKTYLVLESEERQHALTAFKEMIRLVQLFREQVRRVLEYPDSFSPIVLANEMDQLSQKISDTYASNQISFQNDSDIALAHRLKNQCSSAATLLSHFVETRHVEQKQQLKELEAAIASAQVQLRSRARECANVLINSLKKQVEGKIICD